MYSQSTQFGHERLDVYQLALRYAVWAYRLIQSLAGADRHMRDQLLRASQSIPLNIAEGNGKGTLADRRRFFEVARGSALECAAIQDLLVACEITAPEASAQGRTMLLRIVSMLTQLAKRTQQVEATPGRYGDNDDDHDDDHDS